MLCLKRSTLAWEFGTSKLTLHFDPTTVNIHCSMLTFGRIVMPLFPSIHVISAFIAFSSKQPVGLWRIVQVLPPTLHLNELLSPRIFANE